MMSNRYDLYGIAARSLEEARTLVAEALGFSFILHESGYHCGAYYRAGALDGEHFILQKNRDEEDDEWAEPEHQGLPFLLYVNDTERGDHIEAELRKVEAIAHIRTEQV
jgi:hypothetical protein